MPDGAYLINVARGGLVDMDALLAELRKGRITVALDVTDPLEPLPPDHELRQLPNVLLTPHIAAGGIEMRRAIGAVAVEEVVRFCKGEQLGECCNARHAGTDDVNDHRTLNYEPCSYLLGSSSKSES